MRCEYKVVHLQMKKKKNYEDKIWKNLTTTDSQEGEKQILRSKYTVHMSQLCGF